MSEVWEPERLAPLQHTEDTVVEVALGVEWGPAAADNMTRVQDGHLHVSTRTATSLSTEENSNKLLR